MRFVDENGAPFRTEPAADGELQKVAVLDPREAAWSKAWQEPQRVALTIPDRAQRHAAMVKVAEAQVADGRLRGFLTDPDLLHPHQVFAALIDGAERALGREAVRDAVQARINDMGGVC